MATRGSAWLLKLHGNEQQSPPGEGSYQFCSRVKFSHRVALEWSGEGNGPTEPSST